MPLRHIQEGRRPRPAVEVLVPAAHGQVDADAVQVHRDDARRVAQVPEGERTGVRAAAVSAGRSYSSPVR